MVKSSPGSSGRGSPAPSGEQQNSTGYSEFTFRVGRLPDASLNPNARAHFRKKIKTKQELAEAVREAVVVACKDYAFERLKFPWGAVAIRVEWDYWYHTQPDADNALASLKAAFDALTVEGVLEDDRAVIHLPMAFRKVPKAETGFTVTLSKITPGMCPLCGSCDVAKKKPNAALIAAAKVTKTVEDQWNLTAFAAVVERLRAEPKRGQKTAILGEVLDAVNYAAFAAALDPMRVYGITTDMLDLFAPKVTPSEKPPESLRAFLERAPVMGYLEAASAWKGLTQHWTPEAVNVAREIVNKDLRCGVGVKTFNEGLKKARGAAFAVPLQDFGYAAGEPYAGQDVFGGNWYRSRKYDGVRVFVVWAPGATAPQFLSRNAKPIRRLERLAGVLVQKIPDSLKRSGFVLDGELALSMKGEEDDFKGVMSALNTLDPEPIENIRMYAFDLLAYDVFFAMQGKKLWSERQQNLHKVIGLLKSERFIAVAQHEVDDECGLRKATEEAFKADHEGLILRCDLPYMGKRSGLHILKIKGVHDIELVVLKVEMGNRVMGGKKTPCMARAICHYERGGVKSKVAVGGGWSREELLRYYEHPEELVGKTLTVTYMEESEDEKGKPSLRLPRKKTVHEGVRK